MHLYAAFAGQLVNVHSVCDCEQHKLLMRDNSTKKNCNVVGVQAKASANSEQVSHGGDIEQPMTPAECPVLARHLLLRARRLHLNIG